MLLGSVPLLVRVGLLQEVERPRTQEVVVVAVCAGLE
jgi:hypothetical protein